MRTITAVLAPVGTGCLGCALDHGHASLGRGGAQLLALGLEPLLALGLAVAWALAAPLIREVVECEVVPGHGQGLQGASVSVLVLTWSGLHRSDLAILLVGAESVPQFWAASQRRH